MLSSKTFINCQFANHRPLKKHQKKLCIFPDCTYGASCTNVLH